MIMNSEKIVHVGSSYLGAEADPALPLVLNHYFQKKKNKPTFSSAEEIFEELLVMQAELKEHYFLHPQPEENDSFEPLGFQMLIASPQGIFGTYSLRSVQEYCSFYAIGNGSDYALGALEALYERVDSAEDLVRTAITIASEFDTEVGKPGNVYSVKLL